ncbi:MAG: DUF6504 family protein [Coriobacteriia bacterium]|nr:DUF6504 family protein [Coriobacteriia bacterium]
MGRNTAIKGFDAKKAGQPLSLFESAGRRPVVLELLSSPWVMRGSDVDAPKRAEVEVPVEWDGRLGRPAVFTWKGKRYTVDQLVQQWAVDALWWDRGRAVSRRCFRVIARGGVYDLAYDRIRERWLLVGVLD